MRENLERAFHAYGKPMEAVLEFRYLGRLLTATDDDWPAVARNIRKAQVSWGRLARVLGREGGGPESVTEFLYCRDTAGPPLRGGDMGIDAEDGVTSRHLPGQGCKAADREAAPPGEGLKMFLPITSGGFEGGVCCEVQYVDPLETEHGCAIYYDKTDSGPL